MLETVLVALVMVQAPATEALVMVQAPVPARARAAARVEVQWGVGRLPRWVAATGRRRWHWRRGSARRRTRSRGGPSRLGRTACHTQPPSRSMRWWGGQARARARAIYGQQVTPSASPRLTGQPPWQRSGMPQRTLPQPACWAQVKPAVGGMSVQVQGQVQGGPPLPPGQEAAAQRPQVVLQEPPASIQVEKQLPWSRCTGRQGEGSLGGRAAGSNVGTWPLHSAAGGASGGKQQVCEHTGHST